MNSSFKRYGLSALFVLCALLAAGAQTLYDDMFANDIESFNRKAELSEIDLKKGSYIADYLCHNNYHKNGYDYSEKGRNYSQPMLDNLIAKGASVNAVDKYGVGPLYWAVYYNNYGAVKALLAAKAQANAKWTLSKDIRQNSDIYYPNYYDKKEKRWSTHSEDLIMRPLGAATLNADPDIVAMLLKAGADPMGTTYTANKAKKYPAESVFDLVLAYIEASKGKLPDGDSSLFSSDLNLTPSRFASCYEIWQAAMALPKADRPAASVYAAYTNNVYGAFCAGDSKAVKKYLAAPDNNAKMFMPYALFAGNWDIVNYLIQYYGITPDDTIFQYSNNQQSLLSLSILRGQIDATALALKNGVAVPAEIKNGDKSLPVIIAAAMTRKPELLKLIIDTKADVNAQGPDGAALNCCLDSLAMTKMLVEAGATISDDSGISLLCRAAAYGSADVVSYYISKGVDPNGAGNQQPLCSAIGQANISTVKALLEGGADPALPCVSGAVTSYGGDRDRPAYGSSASEYVKFNAARTEETALKSRFNAILSLLSAPQKSAPKNYVLPLFEVQAGTFNMEIDENKNEVTLSSSFMASKLINIVSICRLGFEKAEYGFQGGGRVTLHLMQAVKFCNALSKKEGLTPVYTLSDDGAKIAAVDLKASGYRLPTRAELYYIYMKEPAGLDLCNEDYEMAGEDKEGSSEGPQIDPFNGLSGDKNLFVIYLTYHEYINVNEGGVNAEFPFRIVRNISK